MNPFHRIHLGDAWEPPGLSGAREPSGGSCPGWTRRFGRPGGLGAGDRVWLVIERPGRAALTLNAVPLPSVADGMPRWSHEITSLLADRNLLLLEPLGGPPPAGDVDRHGRCPLPAECGRVVLEIVAAPDAPDPPPRGSTPPASGTAERRV